MKNTHAKTQAELARMLGITRQAVAYWITSSDWTFGRRGPFDVAAVLRWRDKNRRMAQNGGTSPKGREALAEASLPAGEDRPPVPMERDDTRSEPDASPAKSPIEQDLSLKAAREEQLRLKTSIIKGDHVPRDLLDTALAALTELFLSEIEQMIPGLPPRLQGQEACEIERILDERVATIRDRLYQRLADPTNKS